MLDKCLTHTFKEVTHVDVDIDAMLRKYFKEVQVIPEAATYLIDLISYIVSGDRTGQFFVMFQGCGANGNSVLELLLISMLGAYCVTPPIALITKKSGAA